MCLLSLLFGNNDKDKDKNVSGYTDEELDSYGLTKYEKELVKKGKADPSEFNEGEDIDEEEY